MSKGIEIGMSFNFEKYTTIQCLNSNCKYNRRILGDLHCNHKFIEIDEEGKCKQFEKKEE